jgi:type IV pilus assembly protein PilW
MVGISVGMFVVAAAATLVSAQLVDNRRLLVELQLQQDLRTTTDIITRDIRRIGATGATSLTDADNLVWNSANGSNIDTNFGLIYLIHSDENSSEIQFNSPRQMGQIGPYGYKLELSPSEGIIKSQLPAAGSGVWQALTDSDTMKVTNFELTARDEPPVKMICPKFCKNIDGTLPADPTFCWPTITVRSIAIEIEGQAKSDPSIVRRLRSMAHLRNDLVAFNDPTASTVQSCPS